MIPSGFSTLMPWLNFQLFLCICTFVHSELESLFKYAAIKTTFIGFCLNH